MQLVEKHIIRKSSSDGKLIDHYLFLSKNLYNIALYTIRQHYFATKTYINYYQLQKQFQSSNQSDYIALPRKVSQQVLMQVDQSFRNFFKALKTYQTNPNKFLGRPKLPKYKNKVSGRNILTFTNQAISKKDLSLSGGIKFKLPTKLTHNQIVQVRIVPNDLFHTVEIIYNKLEKQPVINDNVAAIDLGINNLATITFNNSNAPIIIPGGPLKSINQYFNKKKAILQSLLENNKKTSKNIRKLTNKRNNKISDYMHKATHNIVNHLVSRNISKLIIGYNKLWKQETNIGEKNNQNFVNIPHHKFINMLKYKCLLEGIDVKIREESYTSKCSFLDLEEIKKHDVYLGRRIKRGLFVSANGNKINADVNGSYNIMRKAIPEIFIEGIEVVVVQPIRLIPNKNVAWNKIPCYV